jgi:hypothetical protein
MKRSHFFISIILAAAVVSAGYWFYEWVKPPDMSTHEGTVEGTPTAAIREDVSDSRADDSTAAENAAIPEIPRLFGTIIMKYNRIAIFEHPVTKSTGVYNPGDSVAGFIISDIQQNKAILLWGDKAIEVRLKGPKGIQTYQQSSAETSRISTRPSRPLIPPGASRVGMPDINSQQASEKITTPEESDDEANWEFISRRFLRKPVHESLATPTTPAPPIQPTYDDEQTSTEKQSGKLN